MNKNEKHEGQRVIDFDVEINWAFEVDFYDFCPQQNQLSAGSSLGRNCGFTHIVWAVKKWSIATETVITKEEK